MIATCTAMGFGLIISLVMTLLAIVFIFIPLISEWAFWILVAACIIHGGSRRW
jgi:hypothetical protein